MSLVLKPGSEWSPTGIGIDASNHISMVLKSETSERRDGPDAYLVKEHHHLGQTLREWNPVAFPTFKERLQHLKKNENHIVCLGESGIHGWGLFAHRAIEEGEWIIEYLGELIRPIVCECRERRYQSEKKDCYFFQVSDSLVIDATKKGNLARFINHSCQPKCFARKLYMGETTRLIFIAKQKIIAGQELTQVALQVYPMF